MNPSAKNNLLYLLPVLFIYVLLTYLSANNCYFWDNIQQITNEAHWFYLTNFSTLFVPAVDTGLGINGTGYHPPLMGLMTAMLWKIFGYKLWVSHVFVFAWFLLLAESLLKIIRHFFAEKWVGWIFIVALMESTLLSQYFVGSPDFILFTAFVMSLRAILMHKRLLLGVGIFFLCGINMRGVFAGAALFAMHCYYNFLLSGKKIELGWIQKMLVPYLPTVLILCSYFTYYFITNGWFTSNFEANGHYSLPSSVGRIVSHVAEFGLRSIENGRILIWLLALYTIYATFKSKIKIETNPAEKALLFLFLALMGLYITFVFITQMPFAARYFMPQFFVLTLIAFWGIKTYLSTRKMVVFSILILCFELTGHLWIYPNKIANSWDCTLAHVPYYELRKECFNYIDSANINYNEISAGFCLYGNQRYIDLGTDKRKIGTQPTNKYFLYSNISNVEDELAYQLEDTKKWKPIKRFEKGFVFIQLLEKLDYESAK